MYRFAPFCNMYQNKNLEIERIAKKVQDDLKKKQQSQSQDNTPVPKESKSEVNEEPGYFDMLNKLAGSVQSRVHEELKVIPKDSVPTFH